MSKRDIYAAFPNKHAILVAVVSMVLQADDENLLNVILLSQGSTTLQDRLEVVALALINEILSPTTGFLFRLISTESISHPQIGVTYFEKWYSRRAELISQAFSEYGRGTAKSMRRRDADQAAKHYIALITHLPQLTVSVGMRDVWNPRSAQTHVRNSVECFLKAYPALAGGA